MATYLVTVIIGLATILTIAILVMTEVLLDPSAVAVAKAHSLSRTQFALWLLVVFCSLVYVWGRQKNLLAPLVLVGETPWLLLCISGMVLIGARAIDGIDQRHVVRDRKVSRHRDRGSRGFFKDVVSDGTGIAIHRLQFALCSLVAMVFFMTCVWATGEIPVFNVCWLLLYAASGVCYLVLKRKENTIIGP